MDAATQQPPRVLVIDDNRDAADSLALLLRVWGFDVRAAYSGKEGMNVARSYRPDCVVSDIGLPEMDGYHLADQFRQDDALKQTPLIAITAYNDAARAKAAGFDEHLLKPADPAALHAILSARHFKEAADHG
jgi:CheY-like chemotaxis protein